VTRDRIYELINLEREAQSWKWNRPHAFGVGDCSSAEVAPSVKATVLLEEAGEVARAVLDGKPDRLSIELVQVAAVAVAWLESLE
jgi:hypothetical protein